MSTNIVREGLRSLLFDARKHDLPMPTNEGFIVPHPKDFEEHVDQEVVNFYTWLIQKYWDEHT